MAGPKMKETQRKGFRLIRLLFAPPYIALLWVGSYDRAAPTVFGIPFFYWYQLLWIPLGALILLPVYLVEERDAKAGEQR